MEQLKIVNELTNPRIRWRERIRRPPTDSVLAWHGLAGNAAATGWDPARIDQA
jgi:hypothetical protein